MLRSSLLSVFCFVLIAFQTLAFAQSKENLLSDIQGRIFKGNVTSRLFAEPLAIEATFLPGPLEDGSLEYTYNIDYTQIKPARGLGFIYRMLKMEDKFLQATEQEKVTGKNRKLVIQEVDELGAGFGEVQVPKLKKNSNEIVYGSIRIKDIKVSKTNEGTALTFRLVSSSPGPLPELSFNYDLKEE